jgi:hypothetical protein
VHEKENSHNRLAKVKRTREEMQITLKNRKKVTTNSPKKMFLRGKT